MNFTTELLDINLMFFTAVIGAIVVALAISLYATISLRRLKKQLDSEKEELNEEQRQRLWEHGIHEDQNFNDRSNFFLIFESVLLGVVGALYSRSTQTLPILRIIAVLGLATALVWLYIQAYYMYYLRTITLRLKKHLEEYRVTLSHRNEAWNVSIRWLLTYAIPSIVVILWLFVFVLLNGTNLGLWV